MKHTTLFFIVLSGLIYGTSLANGQSTLEKLKISSTAPSSSSIAKATPSSLVAVPVADESGDDLPETQQRPKASTIQTTPTEVPSLGRDDPKRNGSDREGTARLPPDAAQTGQGAPATERRSSAFETEAVRTTSLEDVATKVESIASTTSVFEPISATETIPNTRNPGIGLASESAVLSTASVDAGAAISTESTGESSTTASSTGIAAIVVTTAGSDTAVPGNTTSTIRPLETASAASNIPMIGNGTAIAGNDTAVLLNATRTVPALQEAASATPLPIIGNETAILLNATSTISVSVSATPSTPIIGNDTTITGNDTAVLLNATSTLESSATPAVTLVPIISNGTASVLNATRGVLPLNESTIPTATLGPAEALPFLNATASLTSLTGAEPVTATASAIDASLTPTPASNVLGSGSLLPEDTGSGALPPAETAAISEGNQGSAGQPLPTDADPLGRPLPADGAETSGARKTAAQIPSSPLTASSGFGAIQTGSPSPVASTRFRLGASNSTLAWSGIAVSAVASGSGPALSSSTAAFAIGNSNAADRKALPVMAGAGVALVVGVLLL